MNRMFEKDLFLLSLERLSKSTMMRTKCLVYFLLIAQIISTNWKQQKIQKKTLLHIKQFDFKNISESFMKVCSDCKVWKWQVVRGREWQCPLGRTRTNLWGPTQIFWTGAQTLPSSVPASKLPSQVGLFGKHKYFTFL